MQRNMVIEQQEDISKKHLSQQLENGQQKKIIFDEKRFLKEIFDDETDRGL